jgi:hypothetical protein
MARGHTDFRGGIRIVITHCYKEHGKLAVERLLKKQQTGLPNPDRLSAL